MAGEAPAAAGCKNTYLLPGLRIRSALRRWARAPAPGAPPFRAPLPPPRGPAAPSAPPPTPFECARARAPSRRRLSRARACALAARTRARSGGCRGAVRLSRKRRPAGAACGQSSPPRGARVSRPRVTGSQVRSPGGGCRPRSHRTTLGAFSHDAQRTAARSVLRGFCLPSLPCALP